MKKEKILGIVFFLIGLSVSGRALSVEVSKVEEKTFKFSPNGSISLTADEGDVVVKTWEKDEVYLKMTKRAWGRNRREAERLLNEMQVRIYEAANRLVIKELDHRRGEHFNFFDLFDSDFWREKGWRTGVVDYELTVPKKVRLRLKADEGDVEILGAAGKLTIDTDEGDVKIYGSDTKSQGFCEVDADEGRILLEDGVFEELTFRADEGNIEISLPQDASLRVRMRIEEGKIESDFDLPIRGRDDGEVMERVIAHDGGMLKAYAEEGDILLRRD